MKNRMSKEEYRNEINKVHRSGSSPVHKSDEESDFQRTYDEAVSTLRDLQGAFQGFVLTGPISATIISSGNTRADTDNIAKSCLDSAQGLIFENDKQVWKIYGERHP